MQEGILNFGDPLGNYLIASSVKLPYSFVRAFGECPGYLIRWGLIFFGWGTEKILAAINRVPRAFAECPGNDAYHSLPEWDVTFLLRPGIRRMPWVPYSVGCYFLWGVIFSEGNSFFRKEISYSGRVTRSFLCPIWRNGGIKIRKRKGEVPSVGARFLTIREENKQFWAKKIKKFYLWFSIY